MAKIKTDSLSELALDYAVSLCEGQRLKIKTYPSDETFLFCDDDFPLSDEPEVYSPSTDWSYGGPIIERELLLVDYKGSGRWFSFSNKKGSASAFGETPLIAAMRCYVLVKFGEHVDIPDQLLN